ncbi:MAG: T9SS type A sorting domain-containing protein [Saprospiraceae bacterium]|nr:T9SS type A sorting domain-containing protein [Saprospiraceae bacterium]
MNYKFFYCALFSLLFSLASHRTQAQVSTILSTNSSWEAFSMEDQFLQPFTANEIMGMGFWQPVELSATQPDACNGGGLTYPGTPIFSPGNAVCFGKPEDAFITSFFRKNFELSAGANPLCHATVTVRADDAFRLYVDGTLLPGTSLFACGNTGLFLNINGVGSNNIFTIDIQPFLNLSLTTHTILFEVINCSLINYLAASVDIAQELTCTPNAQINFNFFTIDSGSFLDISGVGGIAGCYTHEDWRVYVTPNLGSPYTLLYSIDNSTRTGAARRIQLPVGCHWYRIFHRVKYTKCDGTIVQRESFIGPFSFCTPPGLVAAPQGVIEAASGEVLTEFSDNISADKPFQATVKPVLPEVSAYPNPASSTLTVAIHEAGAAELVRLIDLQGRTVFEKEAPEQQVEIDCTALPSGIYSIQVIYPERGLFVQKVQILH